MDKCSATVGDLLDMDDHVAVSKEVVVLDFCVSPIGYAEGNSSLESHLNVHRHVSFLDAEGSFTSPSEVTLYGVVRAILDTFERVDAS